MSRHSICNGTPVSRPEGEFWKDAMLQQLGLLFRRSGPNLFSLKIKQNRVHGYQNMCTQISQPCSQLLSFAAILFFRLGFGRAILTVGSPFALPVGDTGVDEGLIT